MSYDDSKSRFNSFQTQILTFYVYIEIYSLLMHVTIVQSTWIVNMLYVCTMQLFEANIEFKWLRIQSPFLFSM